MPLVIPVAYYFILPHPEVFAAVPIPSYEEEEVDAPYTPLPTDDSTAEAPKASIALSFEDKWQLVKPLLLKYMLPLCMCLSPHLDFISHHVGSQSLFIRYVLVVPRGGYHD